MLSNPHLTKPEYPVHQMAVKTHEGQASWAGGGPAGRTCFECEHWGAGRDDRPKGPRRKAGCRKWVRLTGGASAAKMFPGTAAACRYFEALESNEATE